MPDSFPYSKLAANPCVEQALQRSAALQSQTLINAFFHEHTVLKTLLKDFRDGVLVCDQDACFVQLNSSLKALWNLDDQVLGKPVASVVSNKSFNEGIDQLMRDGSARVVDMSWRGPGGRFFFETHLIPIWIPATPPLLKQEKSDSPDIPPARPDNAEEALHRNATPDGCVAIFHNITERRRTEKMRRDFVANVSHELRTPLSAIRGYSETLLTDVLLDGEWNNLAISRDFVNVIHRHSLRLSQLVEDLLDLSKLESPDYEPELAPVCLEILLRQAVSMVEDKALDKAIELSTEIDQAPLPLVLAEPNSLQQVLINLLDNAIKYTPAHGRVHITARLLPSEPDVSISLEANRASATRAVEVSVTDNGIGIEPKYLSRIFERFYRVDKARSRDLGGTGLGLAIVKHIVQLHGGEIQVESAVNKGSTFRFRLKTDGPSQVPPNNGTSPA